MIHICQLLYEITTKKFMAEHNNTGKKGEEMAATFLREKGMTILETNWRFGYLEADIIAKFEKTLVIIEVKTRKSNYFGEPESFVTKQKQKNLNNKKNNSDEKKKGNKNITGKVFPYDLERVKKLDLLRMASGKVAEDIILNDKLVEVGDYIVMLIRNIRKIESGKNSEPDNWPCAAYKSNFSLVSAISRFLIVN